MEKIFEPSPELKAKLEALKAQAEEAAALVKIERPGDHIGGCRPPLGGDFKTSEPRWIGAFHR